MPPPIPAPPTPPAQPAEAQGGGPTVSGVAGEGPSRVAENWAKGAEGERSTADELLRLPYGYHVIHGLKKGQSNADVDHLVIGPTGVWVIDSKAWHGQLTAGDGTLWRGRHPIRKEISSVEQQASYARNVLGFDVNPVLCFVGTKLPRPAQMVGRVRVVELPALIEHLTAGQITMLPEHITAALERAGRWRQRPPTIPRASATPSIKRERRRKAADVPRKSNRANRPTRASSTAIRKASTQLFGLALRAAVLVIAVVILAAIYKAVERSGTDLFTPSSTTTTLVGPGYLSVSVSCPAPNGGYRLVGHPKPPLGEKIRVSATIDGAPHFLGEFSTYMTAPPIERVPPSTSTGFDIALVDAVGQAGASYHIDITTPATPC
ncbi:MAG: nuclease-related domain-containing protein [Acidimicrobiales bacterium]